MRALHFLPLVLVALAPLVAARAGDVTKAGGRVEVIFDHPEKFTDVKDSMFGSDEGRDAILAKIRDYIDERAAQDVPAGDKLTVTITDIDLAGAFEPWHNSRLDDVRIIRDVYPPKFDLSFKLTAADGKVVKEGTRHLVDVMFMQRLTPNPDDPLRYEKNLLDDWIRSDFSQLK